MFRRPSMRGHDCEFALEKEDDERTVQFFRHAVPREAL